MSNTKGPDFQPQTMHSLTPKRDGLVDKLHPRFLAQNPTENVRLIHECLRYTFFCIKIVIAW